ncbi:MAG: hypothetical protein ACKO68_01070 [Bacteroidota bacterium]
MKSLQQQLYAAGLVLFLFPALYLSISILLLFLGISVQGWILIPAFIGALILIGVVLRNIKVPPLWVLISAGCLAFSLMISNLYFDVSFDGQWYHQDAIMFLSDGWNPIWDNALVDSAVSGEKACWMNSYPKASWVFQSGILQLSGNVELGKSLHLISLFSFAFLLFSFLQYRVNLGFIKSLVLALMMSISTITLGQIFSFYVDGVLFSFLGIFLLLWIEYLLFDKKVFIWLVFSFIFLVNLKFTGLVYALVFCGIGMVFKLIIDRSIPVKLILNLSLMVLLGVFIIGYPTYVRNTMEKGHPLFPLMGKNNVGKEVAEVQYPKDFFAMNRFEKALKSHGSMPLFTDHDHPSVNKPLFKYDVIKASVPYYRNHQPVEMSPFGPFEAELWILFIPLMLLFLWRKPSWKWLLLIFGLLFSMAIQPEFWNLRYAPQTLLCIGVVCLCLLMDNNPWIPRATSVFMVLFLVNSLIAVDQNWRWVGEKSNPLEHALEANFGKTLKIQQGWMKSFALKLKYYRIIPDYTLDPQETYREFPGDSFTGWKTLVNKP